MPSKSVPRPLLLSKTNLRTSENSYYEYFIEGTSANWVSRKFAQLRSYTERYSYVQDREMS